MKSFSFSLSIFLLLFVFSLQSQEVPTNQSFFIQSALSYGNSLNGCWDIPDVNLRFSNGQNLQVWELSDQQADRKYHFVFAENDGQYNWYYIVPDYTNGSGRIDISGGGNDNGTNIHVWENNPSIAQKFRFHHLGDGRWKIYGKQGKILCLNGQRWQNGTNVHLWDDHDATAVQWCFVPNVGANAYSPDLKHTSNGSGVVGITLANLGSDKSLDYAKINLNDKGIINYSLIRVRKYNPNKNWFKADYSYGELKDMNKKSEEYCHDSWLVFNGKTYGSYDLVQHFDQGGVIYFAPKLQVSPDGKHVSFVGRRNDLYHPVIFNQEAPVYFYPKFRPEYAISSDGSKSCYAVSTKANDYSIYENGKKISAGWFDVEKLIYSDNNDILYVIKDAEKNSYVYLNHKQISINMDFVHECGFVPGTSKVYYYASKNDTPFISADGKVKELMKNLSVNTIYASATKIIFPIKKLRDKNSSFLYSKEYILQTQEWVDYIGHIGPNAPQYKVNEFDRFYYPAYDKNNVPIIVSDGDEVIAKYPQFKDLKFRSLDIIPNGEKYLHFTTMDNKKPIIANFKGEVLISNYETCSYTTNTSDKSVLLYGQTKKGEFPDLVYENCVIVGGKEYKMAFTSVGSYHYYETQAQKLFSVVRDSKNSYSNIYINGVKLDKSWPYIDPETLAVSSDGQYAFLYHDDITGLTYDNHIEMGREYIWRLCVNGENIEGTYGSPVYSKLDNAIIAPKVEGNKVVGVKLTQ
ncbi:MAG: RICIN domain-containing protein [Salinivirgaceae bacterium]|nr:RICIN domain-containing protein [Salinivirgaceae bacterium]